MHAATLPQAQQTSPVPPTAGGSLSGPCYCKILVSSNIAGGIIGKSGSEIANIERETGCTMRLSSNEVYFPGTQQRICSIAGTLDSVTAAILIVLNKLVESTASSLKYGAARKEMAGGISLDQSQDVSGQVGRDGPLKIVCPLVAPKTAVSAIIGKGGHTIKSLTENTGAKVVVSERENGLNERIVYISGTHESVKNAVLAVVQDMQDDSNLRECCLQLEYRNVGGYMDGPYGMHGGGGMHMSPIGGGGGFNGPDMIGYAGVQPHVLATKCEVMIHLPDAAVGSIIGKQGSSMSEIMRRSGAKITISQKGELVPGTNNRVITFTGPISSVHLAHALLMQQYLLFMGGGDSHGSAYGAGGSMMGYGGRPDMPGYSVYGDSFYQSSMGAGADPSRVIRRSRSRAAGSSPYALR